jgi:delta-aminolevulinic acid dehydratase/porphobilinogen synthase
MVQTRFAPDLKLTRRLRRLRTSETLRANGREARLSPEMFILPLFALARARREVESMPGVFTSQWTSP